jgi:hypothetical protein
MNDEEHQDFLRRVYEEQQRQREVRRRRRAAARAAEGPSCPGPLKSSRPEPPADPN